MCISELRSLRGPWEECVYYLRCGKGGNAATETFCAHFRKGHDCGVIPKGNNCDEWAKQLRAARVIVKCPDKMDVKAMCAWITRDETKEKQPEYWKGVKKHMYLLGPIPRHVSDEEASTERCRAVRFALQLINEVTVKKYFSRGGESPWYSEDPSHKPVKVVWEIYAGGVILFNAPISDCLEERALERFPSATE
ncbi:putative retrotransposon hot spot (RHS) protein [Trypanosoma cruzi]|uniref:Putative retrotransposon hot spot (RHS) protein n=1 Tax=Trypanosoma cruzi TaxID=5693 RepID=A0A2V2UVD7_TRYCR|nr:putative retrotransposon hot spot (RHS) protein [Trypanosoma cruzi]